MAVYTFTGTSQTTATFNPAVDSVIFQGVTAPQVTSFEQSGSNVVVNTATGSLTLTGTTIAALNNSNFVLASGGLVRFGVAGAADTVTGSDAGDILFGRTDATNTSVINAGNGDNLVYGGNGPTDSVDGADSITSGAGTDRIFGNAGNDTINSGTGSDTIYGGLGSDNITGSVLNAQTGVYYGGGAGTDTADGADTISITNAGTTTVFGNAGADTITLTQNGGSSTVYGGIGNDTISVTGGALGNIVVYGGTVDTDNIIVNLDASAFATVFGGSSLTDSADLADNISVNGGSSLIYGNGGDDNIDVTVNGGTTVYGGVGSDAIDVNLTSAASKAVIYGGPNSTVVGALNDIITVVGTGSATIFGGAGITDSVDGADSITGGAGADLIYGNAGNDTIATGGGNDTVFGGLGDDSITATTGNVSLSGADGNDAFVFGSSLNSLDTVDGGIGTNSLSYNDDGLGTAELTNVTNIQTITVGNTTTNVAVTTTDSLVAAGKSLAFSASGLTTGTLNFNGAAETNGTFSVTGGQGADTIVGGAGADTIVGGQGGDNLTGGAGNDVFRFAFGDSATTSTTTGVDTITDLNLGTSVVGGAADNIDLPGTITITAGYTPAGGVLTGTTLANAATVANVDAAINTLSSAGVGAGSAALFNIAGQTYLIVETGADHTTFSSTTDLVINVTGVTGTLDASDFS